MVAVSWARVMSNSKAPIPPLHLACTFPLA